MELEKTNDDLKDLIENPRETEGIELKAWVDFDDQTQKAKLARHLGALANHGGGYLVIGFKDDLTHDENRPASLEKYNRDTFTAIIKRYLTPIFQCEVVSVPHSNGNEFPVIRVPSHKGVPIAAKADGPQDGGRTPQGIAKGTYYVRKPGPESAPIIGFEEWSPLIRRCVLNDRDQLLNDIASLLQTPGTTSPIAWQQFVQTQRPPARSARQRLEQWHTDGEKRFLDLLSQAKGFYWPVPIKENRYQLSYLISSDGNGPLPTDLLFNILIEVNNEVRDTVWTGWSMLYPFSNPSIAPRTYPERPDGTGADVLEANLMGYGDFDSSLPDFWRVAPDGRATLVRAYREDRKRSVSRLGRKAGTWLSPETVVRETTELVAHANAFVKRIERATRVGFRCTWIGFKDREINDFDPAVDWRPGRVASVNERTTEGEWSVVQLRAARFTIVAELSCPILRLFGFDDCNAAFVERMAERFIKL